MSVDQPAFARPCRDEIPIRQETLLLDDGYETAVLHHAPIRAPGRPVLYLHGIQSHPGWFVGSAHAVARAGHEVFQVTRRGSGAATAGRGDAPSAGQLLRDVDTAVRSVLARTGARELALVGVSWGGKLLTAYALARPAGIGSLTLVAPGICPQVDVPRRTKLAIVACRLLWPWRLFDIPLSDPALFTDNPAMREYLAGDAARLTRATARFLFTSGALDWTLRRAAARAGGSGPAITVPTTLLLARRDRIIDNAATRAAVERLAAGRAEIVEFDAAHTLEFEPDPTVLYEALSRAVDRA